MAATLRPAATLPVSVTAAMFSSSISNRTSAPLISTVANRSSGKPASRNTDSMARAQPGTLLACFSTPPLPAIKAGAAKRNTCQKGKFQGMTARMTPSGWKATKLLPASVSMSSWARNRSAFEA